jgi:hypothetical protein
MKHLLHEYTEQGKKYPAFLLVNREDDELTITVRSPDRPSDVEGLRMAGNSGCVALDRVAVMKLIVALGEVVPHATNLKTVEPQLPCPPTRWT